MKYFLEPQFVDIKYKIKGKESHFSLPGILTVQVEPFRNPVTGEVQDTEVHVPTGFIWKAAKACRTKVMRIVSLHMTFDDSGHNAYFCYRLSFKGP